MTHPTHLSCPFFLSSSMFAVSLHAEHVTEQEPAAKMLQHHATSIVSVMGKWILHYFIRVFWVFPHLEQSPPRHQALCYSLFLQKPTQDISLLRIFQLSHIVLHSYQSVQCVSVCVCVCVCACMCACVCVHLLHNYALNTCQYIYIYIIFWGITFSLFSALSRRVGTLQILIIIIIIKYTNTLFSCFTIIMIMTMI